MPSTRDSMVMMLTTMPERSRLGALSAEGGVGVVSVIVLFIALSKQEGDHSAKWRWLVRPPGVARVRHTSVLVPPGTLPYPLTSAPLCGTVRDLIYTLIHMIF